MYWEKNPFSLSLCLQGDCLDEVWNSPLYITQCIEKGRQEDNFIYSINTCILTYQTFLAWWSLVPEIVLIRQISTCHMKNSKIVWRKCRPVDALYMEKRYRPGMHLINLQYNLEACKFPRCCSHNYLHTTEKIPHDKITLWRNPSHISHLIFIFFCNLKHRKHHKSHFS